VRLDALGRAKRVAQAASIIGREFSYRVLEGLVSGHTNLPEDHRGLTRRWEEPSTASIPDGAYELKAWGVDTKRNAVVAAAVFTGTQTGEGGPVPPTGKRVEADYTYA